MGALACGPNGGAGGQGGTAGDGGDGGTGDTGGTGGDLGAGGDAGTGAAGEGGTGVGGETGAAGTGGAPTGIGGGAGDTGGTGGTGGASAAAGGNTGGIAGGGSGGTGGDAMPAITLKSVAGPTDRLIGAALGAVHLADPAYAAAARQFNYATPENEMKWDATEPARNVFSFERADAILAFAAQSGMQVKGHTLVWHQQLPAWLTAIQDPTELRAAMINHITQVALHFRGRVIAWDVVNEAVADGGSSLRNSLFLQLLGSRYLDDAFIAANAADPYARLYYNDYGADGMGAKSNYVYNLVKDMLARGVPIHGVGLQMHTGAADSPSAADIAANMQRLAALGLDVAITEMDVAICTGDLEAQSRRFHDIVAACMAQPFCRAVTVWGVTDKYSWRNGQSCATPRPLLFDDNYVPKPAHTGVINAFRGL
jgi:endo-1,4-beta-xylanase